MKSYEINKSAIKRHAISALLTFMTGFSIVLLGEIDTLTIESFQNGAWVGVLFAGVRAGVKGIIEVFVAMRMRK